MSPTNGGHQCHQQNNEEGATNGQIYKISVGG